MKILVSTKETQGRRKNDFNFCEDGEIVGLPIMECTHEAVDGSCGCKRSWSGFDSHKSTTTAKVIEKNITIAELAQTFKCVHAVEGWGDVSDSEAISVAETMADMASAFMVGEVCERRGDYILNRVPIPAEIYLRDSLLVYIGFDDIKQANLCWPNEYTKVAEINCNDCDEIYKLTQNVSNPWLLGEQVIQGWERPLHPGAKETKGLPGCRSLSIGDVIKWADEIWIVQPMGFSKI